MVVAAMIMLAVKVCWLAWNLNYFMDVTIPENL